MDSDPFNSQQPGDSLSQTGNPWQGFAHPDHRSDEYEALVRTLRFASIQLGKFWVEVNAFPVFMNEMKGASIREIERLFLWLQAGSQWNGRVLQPRLIPDLSRSTQREAILMFLSDVRRAHELRALMRTVQEIEPQDLAMLTPMLRRLASSTALVRQLGIETGKIQEVLLRIAAVSGRVSRNQRVQGFFSQLAQIGGFPEAESSREAGRIFQLADTILGTPASVYPWRKPQILGSLQRIRIESWQDRARPALEARKRLQVLLRLEARVTPEQLRELAVKLKAGGAFRAFHSDYKECLKQYHALHRPVEGGKTPEKESPQAMAEKLSDWASYLEQKAVFENNAEARAFFSPLFLGLDTDFAAALEANAWAAQLRSDLKTFDPSTAEGQRDLAFCVRIQECAFSGQELRLKAGAEFCGGDEVKGIQGILSEAEYAGDREFAAIGCEEEARLLEASQLREDLASLGIRSEIPLTQLAVLGTACEALFRVLNRIESAVEVRHSLKNAFAGEHTDLSFIEEARAYVEVIQGSGLPEALRQSFLTAFGPSRLSESSKLVVPALKTLGQVKDHLQRLDDATHGQSRALDELPLLDLLNRIQRALKQPALLGEWVQKMRAEKH